MKHWLMKKVALLLALSMLLSMTAVSAEDLGGDMLPIETVEIEGEYPGGESDVEEIPAPLDVVDLGDLIPEESDVEEVGEDALNALAGGDEFPEEGDSEETAATETEEWAESDSASGGAWDNDALFEAYLRRTLPGLSPRLRQTLASALMGRKSLTAEGLEGSLKLYDALKSRIQSVARGDTHSTEFTLTAADLGIAGMSWTAEELGLADLNTANDNWVAVRNKLGIDANALLYALTADYPYDLYWFQKTSKKVNGVTVGGTKMSGKLTYKTIDGVRTTVSISELYYKMTVEEDYAVDNASGTFVTNDLPTRVTAAVNEINQIVSEYAGLGDREKLTAYANKICALVSYNSEADEASKLDPSIYGDPWQLIYVFDGDPETKVVCEGYAKAFKYLCDLSEFDGDVASELMTGSLSSGKHMWNAVTMPDGRCYLVDLANSDGGDHCNERLFLKGCAGEAGGPWTCAGITFNYDARTLGLYDGTPWLDLSTANYGQDYRVELADVENGEMTSDHARADAEDTVTLTLTPAEGYEAVAPTVKRGADSLVVSAAGENTWSFTMPYGDVTVSGGFQVKAYTITFNTNGGSAVAPITQDYGTAIVAPAAPTKTGHTFAGWEPALPATMPAGDMTVAAKWTVNRYTITFDTNGGSAVAPMTQDYGTAVAAPAAPTKTGYTFAGWEPALPATMPAGDMTVAAKWTVNRYTITFDTNGGSAVAPVTQDYGSAVAAPAAPTKTGYTFAGWEPALPATMPAGDLTVAAKWTVNRYTITFNANGGSAVAPVTQDYGTTVTAPAAPTRKGYTFVRWEPSVPTTMPAGNMTVSAVWKRNAPEGTLLATMKTSGKTALKVSWTKVTNVDGYDVFFSQNASGSAGKYQVKATVAANKSATATISGLKQKTTYRAYVQAWITENGKKTYVGDASPVAYAIAGGSDKKHANPKGVTATPARLALSLGGKATLTAAVTSEKSGKKPLESGGLVRYFSDNTAVAKVTAKGVVTAVGQGSCVIYVLASNGVHRAVNVTVGPRLTKLAFKEKAYTVKKGKALALGDQLTPTPANAVATFTWKTSNKKIATVDANGKVKGVKKGTATITAAADNGLKVSVKVTVK